MWSRNINVFAQLEGNISPSPMVEFDTRLDKSYRQPRLPHSNTKHAKQPQPHWERGAWCNAAQLLLAAQHDRNLWTETPPTATSCHPFPQCISGQPLCNKQLTLSRRTKPRNFAGSSLDTAPFLARLLRVCGLQPQLDSSSRIHRKRRHASFIVGRKPFIAIFEESRPFHAIHS